MLKNVLKIRITLWLILALITAWFVYLKIAPAGKISYAINAGQPNFFIGKLRPEERAELKPDRAIIKGDPAYFYLRAPRKFSQAKLTVKYKNLSGHPVVSAGLLIDKAAWRIELQPLENKIIDQLALVWDVIYDNDLILLQRQKKYASINEFLNNLPERKEIAVYNYDLNEKYLLKDYRKSDRENAIGYGLRGGYQFYTYLKDEILDYRFSFTDLNKNQAPDPIDLSVWRHDQEIYRQRLDDLTDSKASGQAEQRGEINLKLAALPEGIYKVSLSVSDDIVTEKIVSRQSKMSFLGKIWLPDRGNRNIQLYSDASDLNAQTINPAKLQTVWAGDKEVKIAETYRQYNLKPGQGERTLKLEKDDLLLAGNGLFSFSQDGLIDFAVKKVDANLDFNQAGVNYVLAKYRLPQEDKSRPGGQAGWKVAQAEFNLSRAYSEASGILDLGARKYVFLISVPGLKAEDRGGSVEIKEIRIDLAGASLWQKLINFLTNYEKFF